MALGLAERSIVGTKEWLAVGSKEGPVEGLPPLTMEGSLLRIVLGSNDCSDDGNKE
jgi:hypothetical protein